MITGDILNEKLLPIASWGLGDLLKYLERRVYAQSNTTAKIIDARDCVYEHEQKAFKLGLSDCYWISADETLKFEDVSPYYQPFNTLDFVRGFASPTLRLAGSFDKEWQKKGANTYIAKKQPDLSAQLETQASLLASLLGIGDKKTITYGGQIFGQGTTYIPNMSTTHKMLLDFGSILGMKCLNNGFNLTEVQDLYDKIGLADIIESHILRVSLFDIIIGNQDRKNNPGNWGFFKNTKTGETSLAPAYDFNLACVTLFPEKYFSDRAILLKRIGLGGKALSILESWKGTIDVFCTENEIESWRQNFDMLCSALLN